MMKIKSLIIFIVCFILCFCCGYIATHYVRNATITNITQDIITVLDDSNHIWQFSPTLDTTKKESISYHINDKLKLLFYNNGTDLPITDDTIIRVIKHEK